jgi:dTDP-4-amino-4,6-dideoxygalactose transaminase
MRSGSQGQFVDVDMNQRAVFSEEARCVIDVLPFGEAPDWTRHQSERRTIVVDAAASFDACQSFDFPERHKVGVMVSLHATKSLPAGEGGVFFSSDPGWVSEFRRWSNFGMWGSRSSVIPGTNAKMSEFTAAVALASLDSWPSLRNDWIELRALAETAAADFPPGYVPTNDGKLVSPYWNVMLPPAVSGIDLSGFLNSRGIHTRRWWEDGCAAMDAYRGIPANPLPTTSLFARGLIGLPFHLGLSRKDFAHIGSAIRDFARDRE